MSTVPSSERPRKRRAINACILCRKSKVRCDGGNPCQRCVRNDSECQYFDAVKDENVLRIEKLEAEVEELKAAMQFVRTSGQAPGTAALPQHSPPVTLSSGSETGLHGSDHQRQPIVSPMPELQWKQPSKDKNAVEAGLITWVQATFWFQSFFSGCNYLVPIFCAETDTLESVVSRCAFLFDCIVSVGCRAEEGCDSPTYHCLRSRTREHLADVLVTVETPTLEIIQAITIMAGYSENGLLLVALALRFATRMRLEDAVDQLIFKMSRRDAAPVNEEEEKHLYRLARVWHGVCNLELFFSLDGGKMPSTILRTTPRRLRALISHPSRTSIDMRLLSQVELNILRSTAYAKIASHAKNLDEASLHSIVHNTAIELSLWLEEWKHLINSTTAAPDYQRAITILCIQYEWALITLYLKALSAFGNLLMTDFQREMVRSAKEAAVRHLHHILEMPSPSSLPNASSPNQNALPTYLETFKWAIDFVWAKCAFSVLLVLKLSLLLRDPLPSIVLLLRDARKVLEELHKVTVGHIAYFQILQTSVEKCESALRAHMTRLQMNVGAVVETSRSRDAEDDFQEYTPSEFVFEWDFPGLNLRNVPVGWQDLFVDLDFVS